MPRINSDEAQAVTLESYNTHSKEYIRKDTRDARTQAYWPGVEHFLAILKPNQEIFEVGSGDGFDAQRIESAGYKIQRSDPVKSFQEHLQEAGKSVEEYNVLNPMPKKYPAVYANAVLLHLNTEQLRLALRNINNGLINGGLLCIGMKLGDFEGWREKGLSGKRFFKFWHVEDLEAALEQSSYKILDTYVVPDEDYVVITSQKNS